MAAYVAENRKSGFSPSLTAGELDTYLEDKKAMWIDLRDVFSYEKSHVEGAMNLPYELLNDALKHLPEDRLILLYDQTGKKGHQALRQLIGAGFTDVINVSGGFMSLSAYVRALKPQNFILNLPSPTKKTLGKEEDIQDGKKVSEVKEEKVSGPLVVDTRTAEEFAYGAYPGAINISLDEIESRISDLGPKDREIILYCASGARSGYAVRILKHHGFTNVSNGGGIARMMASYKRSQR
jgi:rhodanese-related sulfurtransferase